MVHVIAVSGYIIYIAVIFVRECSLKYVGGATARGKLRSQCSLRLDGLVPQ